MMDGTAITKIAELGQEALKADACLVTVGDRTFSTVPLQHLPPKPEYDPSPLPFNTLQALAEYVKANRDAIELERCILHVASPTVVHLYGPLIGEKRQRFLYATAVCKNLVEKWTGQYHSQEEFIVALQARFLPTLDRAAVLELISKLKSEATLETEDNGVTQVATARAGVHLAKQVTVPNPVTLVPWRTFREVDQPESVFVLRVQEGPRCALFEADGGAWELAAVRNVAAWLAANTSGLPVLR